MLYFFPISWYQILYAWYCCPKLATQVSRKDYAACHSSVLLPFILNYNNITFFPNIIKVQHYQASIFEVA
uniref:Uncharacterized protein n=1 Tax=Arundo donax TaxID=35708 RepID=A0A0A9FAE2_ARUDO